MARYEKGDIVTYYFVLVTDKNTTRVQGWTDNKELAQMYMEFHKCKAYKLKKVTDVLDNIIKMTEENHNDEIVLANLVVKNPDAGKHDEQTRLLTVPITNSEYTFLSEDCKSFMSSRIRYDLLNQLLPYMKPKWQHLLSKIFLDDVIRSEIYSQQSKAIQSIEIDQLAVLIRLFPDHFG